MCVAQDAPGAAGVSDPKAGRWSPPTLGGEMVGAEHAAALVKVVTLLDSFSPDVKTWVVQQLGSNRVQNHVQTRVQTRVQPGIEHDVQLDLNMTLTSSFLQFWKLYPKRQAKKKALVEWRKISPNQDLLGVILHAIESAKGSDEWLRENGRFIPLPSTWLNNRRWEDEHDVEHGLEHGLEHGSSGLSDKGRRTAANAKRFVDRITREDA